jgi:uncharacterized repeat protein (TIGR01451 family)
MKNWFLPGLGIVLISLVNFSAVHGQGHNCASATSVSANTIYFIDTLWTPGGFILGECTTSTANPSHALWYVWNATYNGPVEITSCIPGMGNPDTRLSVFQGSCSPSDCIGADADYYCDSPPLASKVTFNAIQGEQYFIQWDDSWMSSWPLIAQFQWIINTCESVVNGTCYHDLNFNGIKEPDEPVFDGIMERDGVPASQGGTDPYAMCSPFGEHVITIANPPLYHTVVPASHTYTTTDLQPSISGLDFALQPIPGMFDGAVQLYGNFPWIGNNSSAWLHYENIGTEPIEAVLEFHLDPLLEFVSASVTPASISGNTIVWDLGMLQPYDEGSIQLTLYTPPSVPWNTLVTSWATLTVDGTDVDGTNNYDEWKPVVVAAYDPNDKQVTTTTLTPDEVAGGTKLGYTIRFQNTGNAPAVNVIIRDTLDAGLDLSTFEMIGSSHNYELSINDNELVWLFPNIMLPDSTTDFDGSIGTFHYRIAMREDVLLGDHVQNEANIFFDFAEPITTNTVTTTVAIPEAIAELGSQLQFLVHPVPTTGAFNIRWLGDPLSDARIVIADGVGREVKHIGPLQLHKAQDLPMDIDQYANGVYTISIIGNNTAAKARVILRR